MWLLAADEFSEASKQDITEGYWGLIFMGLFFLALLGLAFWWLKRSA